MWLLFFSISFPLLRLLAYFIVDNILYSFLYPFRRRRETGVQHKVKCDTNEMTVEMILPETVADVYLEGMKEYGKDIGTYIEADIDNRLITEATCLFFGHRLPTDDGG